MYWLLEQSVFKLLKSAEASGLRPSAEQQAQFSARFFDDDDGPASRVLTIAGGTAQIAIEGVLTNAPNMMAMLFGGGNTTYAELIQAIAEAEQNPEVQNIVLAVNSPGGQFEGLFDAITALQNVTKPMTTRVGATAASAAFALAAQADEIIASNRASRVGSVGIVATLEVRDDEVSVTSTNAPNKRPDPTTAAGQAVIREELDAMHEIFAEAIATGRGTTIEKVNADFGQGATLLATTAESRGMIDSIAATKLAIVSTEPAASGNITGDSKMNLNELKAQHPELFAQVVQLGVDGERDRVAAHLTMGEASGDMATAVGAINDGSAMTAALQSKYMAAGMNRRDIEDRSGDDLSADGADGAAAPVAETEADLVAAAVEHNFGVEPATQPEA